MEQLEFTLWSALVGWLGLLVVWHLRKGRTGPQLPPGPRGLPVLGSLHLVGELPHRDFTKLADKYGPIVHLKLGFVHTIVVSSPEFAEEVLRRQDENFSTRFTSPKIEELTFDGFHEVVYAEAGPYHKYLKRILKEEMVSLRAQMRFKDSRRVSLMETIQSLHKKSKDGKPVVIVEDLMECLQMTICRLMFHNITNLVREFIPVSRELMFLASAADPGDFMPWLGRLDLFGYNKRARRIIERLDRCMQSVIDEHRDRIKSTGVNQMADIVDICLSLQDQDGKGPLPDGPIKGIMADMMIGGSETSAISSEWALMELLRNPHILQKVKDEIASVVGTERFVEESDLPKLTYLQQMLMESSRLHVIAPVLIPRECVRDTTIGGYHIPAKSRIFVNVFKIHKDPSVWENPLEFNPDRFSQSNLHNKRYDFLPFGSGRRGCPGMDLGNLFVMSLMAQLLHCFDVELPEGQRIEDIDTTEVFGLSCPMKVPLRVVLKPRLPSHLYDGIQVHCED
ncbi:protein MpCYP827A1 [Marchantia polymorpha subsp. ruderalis]|uniref:Cytochrome P450 n=4 Tax=Marchantia polymorpha TaxID=3197 RepID=A0AAF6BHP6_MARPO|nr:hypothetical protein MARPO_0092s0036 [Marchantia polymorpha]BBN11530.1 hypothetical protein Mp_5g12720 [Marchantia polymorpha subsp. ruderalis]|eukprot:PTQ33070.1 hypothetical protein MARPO_0092s0036 [Marchantia polymorpha]